MFAPNLVFLAFPPASRYWAKVRRGLSGQSLIKSNCHNSCTSDDIDMKLGPVTKIDMRNKKTLKSLDDEVIWGSFDFIVIFPIYSQFGAIWKPDSRCIVYKTYIVINSNLLSYKTENKKVSLTQLSTYCFE